MVLAAERAAVAGLEAEVCRRERRLSVRRALAAERAAVADLEAVVAGMLVADGAAGPDDEGEVLRWVEKAEASEAEMAEAAAALAAAPDEPDLAADALPGSTAASGAEAANEGLAAAVMAGVEPVDDAESGDVDAESAPLPNPLDGLFEPERLAGGGPAAGGAAAGGGRDYSENAVEAFSLDPGPPLPFC